MLRPLSDIFPAENYRALLVGLSAPDDAAVYRLDAEHALISTVDFFPPVVDDPYTFGAIAAANALSDVYAMGGEPLLAINLVAYPDGYGMEILTEILRGGAEKVREAGAVIAGGHTVTDKEPKYGLAVTGTVHPNRILAKGGIRQGDVLLLTKPLGVGVITTALKRQAASAEQVDAAVRVMTRLNRDAARLAVAAGCQAATDVTGYGLLGHAHEMAHLSSIDLHLHLDALRWLPGALTLDTFPGGMERNRDYFGTWVEFAPGITEQQRHLLFDPQTSGGLLIAVHPDRAYNLLNDLLAVGEDAVILGSASAGTGKIRVTS